MTGLETVELSLLRQEAEGWFTDLVDVFEKGITDDPYSGHSTDAMETRTMEGVPCAIESGAALEQLSVIAGKVQGTQLFTVTLPAGTAVVVGNHLIVTSRNNLHLTVQAVIGPESYEVERRVIATSEGEHN